MLIDLSKRNIILEHWKYTYKLYINKIYSEFMASDAKVGEIVLVVAVSIFLYYFFWVSILPFMLIDEGNLIHSFFPPLEYAFILPAIFGVIFLGGIVVFTLYHIWDFIKTKNSN